MILRNIKNNKLYDSKYSLENDEYIIYEGSYMIENYKPNLFREIIYGSNKKYIVEKDELETNQNNIIQK